MASKYNFLWFVNGLTRKINLACVFPPISLKWKNENHDGITVDSMYTEKEGFLDLVQ